MNPIITKFLTAWLAAALLLTILDFIYYTILQKDSLQSMIVRVQHVTYKSKPSGAMISVFAMAALLAWFIILPRRSIQEAFLLGILGAIAHGAANYAAIKHWSPQFAATTALWHGFAFAFVHFAVSKLRL